MQILKQPNPALISRNIEVTDFEYAYSIVKDMTALAVEHSLVGLASNQVAFSGRIFIVKIAGEFKAFINPKLKMNQKAGTSFSWEGCASVEGKTCLIKRFKSLTITAQNTKGEFFLLDVSGAIAIRIQHENDHLNGVMITDNAVETRNV